jgi:hypothetical protein
LQYAAPTRSGRADEMVAIVTKSDRAGHRAVETSGACSRYDVDDDAPFTAGPAHPLPSVEDGLVVRPRPRRGVDGSRDAKSSS